MARAAGAARQCAWLWRQRSHMKTVGPRPDKLGQAVMAQAFMNGFSSMHSSPFSDLSFWAESARRSSVRLLGAFKRPIQT